jgi:hypothetical protein
MTHIKWSRLVNKNVQQMALSTYIKCRQQIMQTYGRGKRHNLFHEMLDCLLTKHNVCCNINVNKCHISLWQHSTPDKMKWCKITDDQITGSIVYTEYYRSRLITGTRLNWQKARPKVMAMNIRLVPLTWSMAELSTLKALWSTPREWNFLMFSHNITVLLLRKCTHEAKVSYLYLKQTPDSELSYCYNIHNFCLSKEAYLLTVKMLGSIMKLA